MKFAYLLAVVAAAEAQDPESQIEQLDMTGQQVEQFVAGLLQGLIRKDDMSEIEQCMGDAKGLVDDITEAVNDFKQKDISHIVAGIQEIGKIIQELPDELNECKAIQGDIQRIEKWASIFKNPLVLVPNLIANVTTHLGAILKDVGSIQSDFAANKFEAAGETSLTSWFKSLARSQKPQPHWSQRTLPLPNGEEFTSLCYQNFDHIKSNFKY